jgi:hypothetical protein
MEVFSIIISSLPLEGGINYSLDSSPLRGED